MATSKTSRSGEQGAPAETSGDQPRPTAPRATLPSVNPYNGQTLKTYLEMSAEEWITPLQRRMIAFQLGVASPSSSAPACCTARLRCAANVSTSLRASWPSK
jgi:hypothetical protein